VASVASITSLASVSSRRGGTVASAGSIGHLNRDDTTKGTSISRVLAADHADVVLASDLAGTRLVGGNSRDERVVGSAASVVATTLVASHVGRHLDVLPALGRAVRVDHALERASTVGVDLVDRHLERAA